MNLCKGFIMQELRLARKTALAEGACVTVPPSKSLSNRALLMAALGRGECLVRNVLKSDDTERMLEALTALGVTLTRLEDGAVMVHGQGGLFKTSKPLTLDLGNAGTAMRPLCAALAFSEGTFTLTGEARMLERPIGPLTEALKELGASIEYLNNDGFPPLKIRGACPHSHSVHISGSTSSQFVTALLMTGPLLEGGLEIRVQGDLISKPYVDLTLSLMQRFGAKVSREGYVRFNVEGTGYVNPKEITVEGDASSASYFLALGALLGSLTVKGLGRNSVQGDVHFAGVLKKMGADITLHGESIEVKKSALKGIDIDMNDMPDAAMTLIPLALFTDGPVTVRNVASWRVKETDRLSALATEMAKLGVKVEQGADYLSVDGSVRNAITPVFATYNDHRMAMCLSLIAADREVVIEDPDCCRKTFPGYFDIFNALTR